MYQMGIQFRTSIEYQIKPITQSFPELLHSSGKLGKPKPNNFLEKLTRERRFLNETNQKIFKTFTSNFINFGRYIFNFL